MHSSALSLFENQTEKTSLIYEEKVNDSNYVLNSPKHSER